MKFTSQVEGLNSYAGVVFVSKTADDKTVSQVCESNKPAKEAPLIPQLIGGKIICMPGSTEIKKTLK